MRLQLWTVVDGEPEELIGEIDCTEEQWNAAQDNAFDGTWFISELASAVAAHQEKAR